MEEIEKMAKVVRGAKNLSGRSKKQAYVFIDSVVEGLNLAKAKAKKNRQVTLVKHLQILIDSFLEEKENLTYYSVSDTDNLSPGKHSGYNTQEEAEHRVKTLHTASAAIRGRGRKPVEEENIEEQLQEEAGLLNEIYEELPQDPEYKDSNIKMMRGIIQELFKDLEMKAGKIMQPSSGGKYDVTAQKEIPGALGQRGREIIKPNVDETTNMVLKVITEFVHELKDYGADGARAAIEEIENWIQSITDDSRYIEKPSGEGSFHELGIYNNMLGNLKQLVEELKRGISEGRFGKWENALLKRPSVRHLLNEFKNKLFDVAGIEDKLIAESEKPRGLDALTDEEADKKNQKRKVSQFLREEDKRKDWKVKKTDWWETIKEAGAVTTATQGTAPLFNNQAINPPKKEEEEEYDIVPDEMDFWRD